MLEGTQPLAGARSIVWRSPIPSSGYIRGLDVQLRPRREIALTFEFEDANAEVHSGQLIFIDVVHYRTTYLYALTAKVITEAYDQVVDVGTSPLLSEIKEAMQANGRTAEMRHYRACFDDGPYFEVIAARFEARIA